jgi:predicted nucleic acid-binding protein
LSIFVDTSIWSLALRRDVPASAKEVRALTQTIQAGETIVTTGLVLQKLLQGFSGPRNRAQIF